MRYARRSPTTRTPGATTSRSSGHLHDRGARRAATTGPQYRTLRTLSGGEQKRLVLEFLLAGPDEVLLLDEPDNYLDVPGKIWLEQRIRESPKTIVLISHDRELLANTATRIVTVELGSAGNLGLDPPGRVRLVPRGAGGRFAAVRRAPPRWDEEHDKLAHSMLTYKQKATYNDGMASRYQAAQTRLRKFEEAGPPTEQPREQQVTMRLTGAAPASARWSATTSSSPG